MRRFIHSFSLLVLASTTVHAAEPRQLCIYRSLPSVTCDGTSHSAKLHLPMSAGEPLAIASAYYQLHTGTAPLQLIGGLISVAVAAPDGHVLIVGGMNRHGAARWTHDPPIVMDGDSREVVVTYGCQIPRQRRTAWYLVRWAVASLRIADTGDLGAGITPDIQVCVLDR